AQQLELRRVVTGRWLERQAVVRTVGEADAIAVGLEPAVALADPVGRPPARVELRLADEREQRPVVVVGRQPDVEVVLRRPRRGLSPRPRLAVEVARLAADGVRDAEAR